MLLGAVDVVPVGSCARSGFASAWVSCFNQHPPRLNAFLKAGEERKHDWVPAPDSCLYVLRRRGLIQ